MLGHSLVELTEHDNSAADIMLHSMYIYVLLYIHSTCMYVMYVWSHIVYSKSMDQPGKVVNPARGQLNREN